RARFGYLVDSSSDPSRQLVLADDSAFLLDRSHVVGGGTPSAATPLDMPLWPTTHSAERKYELVWTGATNRYFAAVTIPLLPASAGGTLLVKNLPNIESVDRLFAFDGVDGAVALRLNSGKTSVKPGESLDMSQGFFAGPMSAREINKDPLGKNAGLAQLVLFNFGGMCGCCTFAWLTQPLLGLLTFLHTITGDWAVGIICLVVIVKSLLHPITRWSQIRLQRFGKQMQGMAPKMAKLKEKYASEPKVLQEETAKLWREEGINPAGALGCLPMFLQTPVWMALSATLFFAIELRHQGAFYGVFQMLGSPGNVVWFLGDLAEPDRLWYFPARAFNIPLISGLMGPISSLNIMPLCLGVLFYVQQKYMTPPPTTAQTPEQETQAKMMRWMTVVMFPVMMYNAPSGLTLYFFANSALGILESKWIKKHIDTHDLLNVQKIREAKAKKGGGGFMARLQQMAQAQQAKKAKQIAGQAPKDPDRYVRKKL
ncbi:MAG: membrane protein insertase YidC, partial [Planctomycetota bacterium]